MHCEVLKYKETIFVENIALKCFLVVFLESFPFKKGIHFIIITFTNQYFDYCQEAAVWTICDHVPQNACEVVRKYNFELQTKCESCII